MRRRRGRRWTRKRRRDEEEEEAEGGGGDRGRMRRRMMEEEEEEGEGKDMFPEIWRLCDLDRMLPSDMVNMLRDRNSNVIIYEGGGGEGGEGGKGNEEGKFFFAPNMPPAQQEGQRTYGSEHAGA